MHLPKHHAVLMTKSKIATAVTPSRWEYVNKSSKKEPIHTDQHRARATIMGHYHAVPGA